MFVHKGQIAGHHSERAALDEAEHLLLIWGVQVVREDSSYTTALSSVVDVEVPIKPFIKVGLVLWVVLVTGLQGFVELKDITKVYPQTQVT